MLPGPYETEKWRYYTYAEEVFLSLVLFCKDTLFIFVLLWRSRLTYSCSHRSQWVPSSLVHWYKQRVLSGYITARNPNAAVYHPLCTELNHYVKRTEESNLYFLLVKGLGPRITSVVFSKQLLASSIILTELVSILWLIYSKPALLKWMGSRPWILEELLVYS